MMINERICVATFGVMVAACGLLGGPSKVRSGQLFATGEARYDAYFNDVHKLQTDALVWDDQKKSVRRPVVSALKLAPDVADVTIVQAAHEKMVALSKRGAVFHLTVNNEGVKSESSGANGNESAQEWFKAIEVTARDELARAKVLGDFPPRVDEVLKTGHELEPQVRDTFVKHGGQVPSEVRDEIHASFDVLNGLSLRARKGMREAEDFVADLARSVNTDAPSAPPPATEAKPRPSRPTGPRPQRASAPAAPAPKPAESKERKEPKPEPAKPSQAAGEVFSP